MTRAVVFAAGAGVAAIVAAAGIAVAQPGEASRTARDITRQELIQRVDERFAQLDANGDGRVTGDERRAARERRRVEMADRMFDRLDADNNGSITREEMREGRMRRGPGRGMRMAGPGGPGGPGMDDGHGRRGHGMRGGGGRGRAFAMREVTREEMRERALARFDRMDANRDGTLTVEERREAREARRERMRMRREQDS